MSENQKIPFVYSLDGTGAVRYDDIEEIGDHTTTQFAGSFRPVSWLTIRASRGEGFKAPRLYALRGPTTSSTVGTNSQRWMWPWTRRSTSAVSRRKGPGWSRSP